MMCENTLVGYYLESTTLEKPFEPQLPLFFKICASTSNWFLNHLLRAFGRSVKLSQIEASSLLVFDQGHPLFQQLQSPGKLGEECLLDIDRLGSRDLRITKVSVQRRKQVKRIFVTVGQGYSPFRVPKKGGWGRSPVRTMPGPAGLG